MEDNEEKQNKMETSLSGHKRDRKKLHPPLATIGMSFSSWKDNRMPEMLWAVLAIGNLERNQYLEFFRHAIAFVQVNNDCCDVTISGIARFSLEKRKEFISHLLFWSDEIKSILTPLIFFPDLPGLNEWQELLDKSESDDAIKIANGVAKVLWHQSEEATDCRWVKFVCFISGGKIKFSSRISGIDDTLKGIREYPNYGNLEHIRPFIRSSEMYLGVEEGVVSVWSDHFWDICYKRTECLPETTSKPLKGMDLTELAEKRNHYFDEVIKIKKTLIDHFFDTSKTTAADNMHEAVFGLSLYALSLLIEIIINRNNFSVTGRLALRSIVESRITLAYLIKKNDLETWKSYRDYGSGQAKLVYLKLDETNDVPSSIDLEKQREIANEDKWQEFVSINLGHWDSTTLRQMSEDSDLKDLYDKYFNWTSGYIHSNWSAVREIALEKCLNPLHRLHRIPNVGYQFLPDIIEDALSELNAILELVSNCYPEYKERISLHTTLT